MNNRKLLAVALGAVAFVLGFWACPTGQAQTTTKHGQGGDPPASGQASKPNVKTEGVSFRVITAMINSIGHSRDDLMKVIGVPDETPISSDDSRAFWSWRINERPGDVWYIWASTTNSTKAVDHIFITFARQMNVNSFARVFVGSRKDYWGGESYSSKKSLVVVGNNADGREVRIYCYSNIPIVVTEPSVDENGKRVEHFTRNPRLTGADVFVQKIAVGTNPIMNGSSDGYLYKMGPWKELK